MSSLAETSWAIKDDLIQPSSVAQRKCAAVAKFKE